MDKISSSKSFTLVELLVVIGILAILTAAVVVLLNPTEYLKQTRDTTRMNDLSQVNQALSVLDSQATVSFGTAKTVYVSIPDTSSSCANLGLPSLPAGYSYNCVTSANLQNVNGIGWIPVDFTQAAALSFSTLPIDPINTTSTGNYYTYTPGGSWEITAFMESKKYSAGGSNDVVTKNIGSNSNQFVYEVGTNLSLLAPPSPVIWLKASIGVTYNGSNQITSWADQSGNNNNFSDNHGLTYAPFFQTNQVNGLPALQFGSVCSGGYCSLLAANVVTTDEETVFIVFKKSGSVTNNVVFGSSNSAHELYIDQYGSAVRYNRGCFSAGCLTNTTYAWGNNWSIATTIASVASSSISVLQNGKTVSGPASYTQTGVSGKYNLGSRYDNSDHLDGYIAEMIVYNSRLSDFFIRQIEQYLALKYSITLQ